MTDMIYGSIPAQRGEPIVPKWWRTVDKWTLSCVLILFAIGLLLGLAASPPLAERNNHEPFYYVTNQFAYGVVAIGLMVFLSLRSQTANRRLAIIIFFLSLVAVLLLPIFGTDYGQGSVRWYRLGFGSLQPSEFLKPSFVVMSAWLLAGSQTTYGAPKLTWSFLLCLSIMALLILQPDYGQASLILFAWVVMYFVAGGALWILFAIIICTLLFGSIAYSYSEHVARRIDGFLNPEIDPTTQLGFAMRAIGEGGLFGVGVGEGQVKTRLTDAHTDFIVAVAAEEYGLLLVFVIIGLYATIALRSLARLKCERDFFIRLTGTGLCALFTCQAMMNLCVAVRLLPTKGMTLPFISYGGSSMVAGGILIGLLLAFTRSRPQGEFHDILRGKSK